MTPRGTTYVTVGSHGFYYRETISSRDSIPRGEANEHLTPHALGADATIGTAGSMELTDSSSDKLIRQLNERAKMFNPAWLLFLAATMSLSGLALLPEAPGLPNLPLGIGHLSDRGANRTDEYAALTARYGEPTSIKYSEADPLAGIPVGTAEYASISSGITFVPNECLHAYAEVTRIRADSLLTAASVIREMRKVIPCHPTANSGWTTIKYLDTTLNSPISAEEAQRRFDTLTIRQTTPPRIENAKDNAKQPTVSRRRDRQSAVRPEMKSNADISLAWQKEVKVTQTASTQLFLVKITLVFVAVGISIAGFVVHKKNEEKRTSHLIYELDEAEERKHNAIREAISSLSKCHGLWRIETKSPTADWKRNAGASSLVERTTIGVGITSPPRVNTNVPVPCINLGRSQLYFFPDTVLYRDNNGYGGIGYSDFNVNHSVARFIEDGEVPADAMVVANTWRYVNKNGGPDRRFNNNRQLPILQLGVLTFGSTNGLNIQLNTSNSEMSLAFANLWPTQLRQNTESYRQKNRSRITPPTAESTPSPTSVARSVLGLNDNASEVEVSNAYHRLARLWHPDKVAGLAPEYQELADKKMKEINAAYEILKPKS